MHDWLGLLTPPARNGGAKRHTARPKVVQLNLEQKKERAARTCASMFRVQPYPERDVMLERLLDEAHMQPKQAQSFINVWCKANNIKL